MIAPTSRRANIPIVALPHRRAGVVVLTVAMLAVAKMAAAEDALRHSVALSVIADESDNRQWLGKMVLPLGDFISIQANAGQAKFDGVPGNTGIVGGALGADGGNIGAALEFTRRKNATFELKDWRAVVNWRGAGGGLGIDAALRAADGGQSESTTQTNGLLGSTLTTTTTFESADGRGFGLHGHLDVTEQVRLFAGFMRYSYDFERTSTTSGSGNALLPSVLGGVAVSGVTRDQALIDRSYQVGASYRLERHALSAQYLRDRVVQTGEILNTLQLQAEIAVGRQWAVTPLIGRSTSDRSGGVNFGGLGAAFRW